MTKYKQITQQEVQEAVLKELPEINPQLVKNTLKRQNIEYFSVLDIYKWIDYFERLLYDNRKGFEIYVK